ncbi:MAG: hypothetical protein ACK2UE_12720 [Anaerolineales bacterium]
MSTIAELIVRCSAMLMDTGLAIWDAGTLGEAFLQALDQYNDVNPLHMETVITLPGDGREIALNGIDGLLGVIDVWWPYDSGAARETWPPNRVRGWRLWWDDAQPVLFLEIKDGSQPQTDEEVRIWYTKCQTIQDLKDADITTIQEDHESLLVMGAAGHAAMSRAIDLVETVGTDLYQVGVLGTWGQRKLREFQAAIRELERQYARRGPSWGQGWQLDKWDERV